MENAMMVVFAVAGVGFSVVIALLVEEVVVGGMFRLMFARAHAQRSEQRRREKEYVAD
ncbi:MAG TPA: hypothetical protein VJ756_00570 [Terriglobales bacterium]|jgi:hypothetical protein|nr:hypothetical protein [Terriglobales bacterium]